MAKVLRDEMGQRLKRHDAAYNDDGTPKYIRIYDNGGETVDRFTVVFGHLKTGWCHFTGMSERPFSPQGFCQHGEHRTVIDRPSYGHLGKKIKFSDLNEDCRKAVMQDYTYYWG